MTLCSSLRSWIWACVSCGWPAARQAAGLDSALCLTMPTLGTVLAMTVGGASCVPLIATFGQAGTATQLPERDLGRLNMQAALTTDRVGVWTLYGAFFGSKTAGSGSLGQLWRICGQTPLPGGARNTGRRGTDVSCQIWSWPPGHVPPCHIYKRMGWDEPRRMRAVKVHWMLTKADRPNGVWETDIAHVWHGSAAG